MVVFKATKIDFWYKLNEIGEAQAGNNAQALSIAQTPEALK